MKYTVSQEDAIKTIDKDLQIIACAGSGKTQVISARVSHSLKEILNIAPANIVALTYNDKAAAELKERIHRLYVEEFGTAKGLAEMFVGTIHGYCLELLQSPPVYKYLKYKVLNEIQRKLFIDRFSSKSGLTATPFNHKDGCLERWKDSGLFIEMLDILAEGDVDWSLVPEDVKLSREAYLKLCDEHRYLDFSRIIQEAVFEIKTNKALRQVLADKLRFLVVDEYQDANPLQEKLVMELKGLGANLCVVGDDDQTIYQWRGSDVSNILSFSERYSDVKTVSLNENFRSSVGIVEPARRLAERNNPNRLAKKMSSTDAQPYAKGDVLTLAFKSPEEEAMAIANKIKQLHSTAYTDKEGKQERGLCYSDFAILLRKRRDASAIVAELKRQGIRYVFRGMNNLFETLEINLICQVFSYLSGSGGISELELAFHRAELGLDASSIEQGLKFLEERRALITIDRTDAALFLQRVYLDLLGNLKLTELQIDIYNAEMGRDDRTGEIVFYNLGKFSQVISDFENIHLNSSPIRLYEQFAKFLRYDAPNYYPEGYEERAIGSVDAVQILTVHQSKGMQWPVVFVPCLRRNTFPSSRLGGLNVWHVLPVGCVKNAERYRGSIEDERRLFYVAITRAERYLFCSWAPIAGNTRQIAESQFMSELRSSSYVLSKEPERVYPPKIQSRQRSGDINVYLTFSELKYFFMCPYLFKLRYLYGFNEPINKAIGYGNSIHNVLRQIHAESMNGNITNESDIPRLIDEHLYLPFANEEVRERLRNEGIKDLKSYLKQHGHKLSKIEHIEKLIELRLDDGIIVNGRIDLIRRTDTNEIAIVDFKSDHRAQSEDISVLQLHVYSVGYEYLTGQKADLIEIHNLDRDDIYREVVDEETNNLTISLIKAAGKSLKENKLSPSVACSRDCSKCEFDTLCSSKGRA